MTFNIARNQIHIDWKLACSGIAIIVSTTWGAAWFVKSGYDEYRNDQKETRSALIAIKDELSSQRVVINSVSRWRDSLNLTAMRPATLRTEHATRFYTERWVNGKMILTEVKPN
jgi:hypothetical protein